MKLRWLRRAKNSIVEITDYTNPPWNSKLSRCQLKHKCHSLLNLYSHLPDYLNADWYYIAKDNRQAAFQTARKIRKSGNLLISNPNLGRVGRVLGTRELIVPGTHYILPYRVQGNEIQILHVLHDARQWPEEFESD